ncbi:MAG: S8 family serine peptidase, partial [Actinomycetia bacterium]|nr:S8 family serine peptidase [Actinomycetes bacterium]
SMASPVAAGVAALIRWRNPGLSPLQVEQLIETSSVDLGAVGFDTTFGVGRVNLAAALNNTPLVKTGADTLARTSIGFLLLMVGVVVVIRKSRDKATS